MLILMRRNAIVAGEHRDVGEVVEVEDSLGEALIFMKRAVLAPAEVEAAAMTPAEQAVQPKAKKST